jgi:isopenicillin N synthase-like dioxygenase
LLTAYTTDFETRRDEITSQLVEAAENSGFFMLVDHGISVDEIKHQFGISKSFFDLPKDVKGKTAYDLNAGLGWEYKAQTRRLTGTDQKESLWLSHHSNWPSERDDPGFQE